MEKKESLKPAESLHWADQTARKVIEEKGEKDTYTVAAGITPSGTIHIGNFREIITVDLVHRALKNLGKNVKFIYSWDNFDVFRKVPIDAPQKEVLEKYLRFPITEVPDTYDKNHKSYAEHNEKEVETTIPFVDIHPRFLYQAQKYGSCEYAEEIKHALANKDKIKAALDKFRTEEHGKDWLPVSVFCSKCHKDTTKVTTWDGAYQLAYKCDCHHEETFDFRKKGIAKLPWRIDWPMRWHHENVDFEPGGKEHSSAGGSRDTAVEIFAALYKGTPPVYLKYDFITIKGTGGKISKSLGNVISLRDSLEVYEPSMVRWFFASTRPDAEFAISFDLDVIKYYEDFDRCERIYYGKEAAKDEKDAAQEKRIYELSAVRLYEKMPFQPSFRHLTTIYQMYLGDEGRIVEHFKEGLETPIDNERLVLRMKCVKNWLRKYAPEDMKFTVQDTISPETRKSLSPLQIAALKRLKDILAAKRHDERSLVESIKSLPEEAKIPTGDFFKAAYQVLLNKDRGPKLAGFIVLLGQDKVGALLEQL